MSRLLKVYAACLLTFGLFCGSGLLSRFDQQNRFRAFQAFDRKAVAATTIQEVKAHAQTLSSTLGAMEKTNALSFVLARMYVYAATIFSAVVCWRLFMGPDHRNSERVDGDRLGSAGAPPSPSS